jgi:hypothetical protein
VTTDAEQAAIEAESVTWCRNMAQNAIRDAATAMRSYRRAVRELSRLHDVETIEGASGRVIPMAVEQVDYHLATLAAFTPKGDQQ